MVNISTLRLGPLLRVLNHRMRTGRWLELRQLLANARSSRSIRAMAAARFSPGRRPSHEPPALFQMASAYWISQAIYVAAKFGIADALKEGPKSGSELAWAVQADEDSLVRLMRVLCMLEVCRVTESQRFELTPLGVPLQSGVPGSLRSMVMTLGEIHYQAWGHLCDSVQTGRPGFRPVFGSEMFDFLAKNCTPGETFNRAMTDFSSFVAHAVLLSYDFSKMKSIIDVGGGYGKLLTSILDVYPRLQGLLVDLPEVVAVAKEYIEPLPCHDRCAAVAGSFLESVPCGADAYLLSGILHDWDDEKAHRILRNCRKAMRPNTKVLVVECIVPEGDEPSFSKLLDLNMMVMTGGRERTKREFSELFSAAGLALTRTIPTPSPLSMLEAVCK